MPSRHQLLTASGSQIATWIRKREVSSLEAVSTHIDLARAVNPRLNAIVRDRFDEALQEARAVDARLDRETPQPWPPFLGVPCSIKEAFALEGMPNTSGLVARRGTVATQDATAVARIRASGAIPIGVTNISELCMYMESDNCVYGRTNNPYDPRRIAGGSSGGEGAIIASGASPFGLGSDIGGSIRMPCFFNGIFGHKPTGGLVSGWGQFPFAHGAARRYLTTGPMARRAEDLWPLLRLLAGPDGHDTGCMQVDLADSCGVDLRKLRVLLVTDNGAVAVSDDVRASVERAAEALSQAGARVIPTRIPGLRRSFDIWSSMLSEAGGPKFAELMGQGVAIRSGRELVRWAMGRSKHTLPAIGLAILEKAPALTRARTQRFVEEGHRLRAEIASAIGPDGVMLYPPYATTAPRHHVSLVPPFKWIYTAVMNALELPVTQTPLGLDRRGLPLGVQVVGAHGRDAVTIGVAMELERRFGGWVPPPLFHQSRANAA
jgi:fatty acid amide hydrolase 2